MKRPTPFEIMRRNRRRIEACVSAADADLAWDAHREEVARERRACYADTADWMASTRQHAEPALRVNVEAPAGIYRPTRRPGLLRRAWNYAFGFGANA